MTDLDSKLHVEELPKLAPWGFAKLQTGGRALSYSKIINLFLSQKEKKTSNASFKQTNCSMQDCTRTLFFFSIKNCFWILPGRKIFLIPFRSICLESRYDFIHFGLSISIHFFIVRDYLVPKWRFFLSSKNR